MKAQGKSWTCGIAAATNALECLGIRATQAQVAKHCHTDVVVGTDETEVKRALLAYGCGVDEWEFNMEVLSHDWLKEHLIRRGPAILCVDDWEHYITCIGLCGGSYVCFDPSLGAGIRVYTRAGLNTRWRLSRGRSGPIWYALGVSYDRPL